MNSPLSHLQASRENSTDGALRSTCVDAARSETHQPESPELAALRRAPGAYLCDGEASAPETRKEEASAKTPPRTFKCQQCGEEFEAGWSDEEANAEALANWGVADASTKPGMSVVCDPCYRVMIRNYPPGRFAREAATSDPRSLHRVVAKRLIEDMAEYGRRPSMEEIERLWMESEDALRRGSGPTGPGANVGVFGSEPAPCCVGTDVPEAGGLVHSPDCPRLHVEVEVPQLLLRSMLDEEIGEFPASLRRHLDGSKITDADKLATRLTATLLFAARDLAESNIERVEALVIDSVRPAFCVECQIVEIASRGIKHAPTCNTGRVLAVVKQFMALVRDDRYFQSQNLTGKEAAPAEGEGCAGDGIRPRGDLGEPWRVRSFGSETSSLIDIVDAQDHHCANCCDEAKATRIVDCVNSMAGKEAEPAEWVIQRRTGEWKGNTLVYEDFPASEGLMTRSQMLEALDKVSRENPQSEFRGHRVAYRRGGAR